MTRVAALLAGGKSRRMGGKDKATVELGGRRLVDLVLERLAPQAGVIVISGPRDYGTGFVSVADVCAGPKGPVAGVFAVSHWLKARFPRADGFVTAPVDGPFLPFDLIERLSAGGRAAVAVDDEGVHPTFAYWTLVALESPWRELCGEGSVSLRRLAEACCAREVRWPGAGHFRNINTPHDLEAAINHRP